MTILEKTIKFPHRQAIGTLYVAPFAQPEEWELLKQVRGLIVAAENQPIKWEWLEEARGNVVVPANAKLKLKIATKGVSFSALDDLESDDLHAIDLSHCQITDAAAQHLSKLTGLKSLELTSTSLGDEGLVPVGNLVNLQSLGLSHSKVTTHGLLHLAKLTKLREIWLSGTQVDDLALQYCAGMNLLVQMGLSGTKVTDAGLHHLAQLPNLLRVYLFNTKVSHNGTQELKRLLPELKVKWHPTKSHTQDAYEPNGNGIVKTEVDGEQLMMANLPIALSEAKFWEIINLLDWRQSGDDLAIIEPATEALAKMSVEEICGFAEILAEKLYMLDGEVYAGQIGSDAYLGIKGDFSKNWFLYVRCCVVANGQSFYEEVLSDAKQMPKDMEFQALLSLAAKAYKQKIGQRFNYATKYNYETFSNKQLWSRP